MSKLVEKISDFTFIKDIGEGNFGKVKLGVSKKTGDNYAIKIMNKEKIRNQMGKILIPEIEISKKFNHKNVIRVYSILEDEKNYYIIMEYCSKGELFDYIVAKKKLSEEESSIFFYQLINGIEYIHNKGYAHRDLKPENLLLTSKNILKIIDFGLTHEYNENTLLKTKCGSPSYAAPEILKGCKYDGFKSDVWCCGIILYAMLSGSLPFEGETNKILFKNIIKCQYKLNQFENEEIKDLIKSILNPNPNSRIDLKQIKENKFYIKGEKLFLKMEINNYIEDRHNKQIINDRVSFKTFRNNINDNNSKSQNSNIYKIFDKISNEKLDKLNIKIFNNTNDNYSINNVSKKSNLDKKSLDMRILQTSKNAEEIILRHSNMNNQLKIMPYLKKLKSKKLKNDYIFKNNINEKIKKLLKKNNSDEGSNEIIENIKKNFIPNIKRVNRDYLLNNNSNDSDMMIKNENLKIFGATSLKKESLNSLSLQTKMHDINNKYKLIKGKNKFNERYEKKLIVTEPFNFKSQEKDYKSNNDKKKSYNLYKIISNGNKYSKSPSLRYKLTENSNLFKKKVIELKDKEIFNEILPLLNTFKSKKQFKIE